MLNKMILSTEDMWFFVVLTTGVVMCFEMFCARVKLIAISTMTLSSIRRNNRSSKRRTSPPLKIQMKRLLMPSPVILTLKTITAKRTREPSLLRDLALGRTPLRLGNSSRPPSCRRSYRNIGNTRRTTYRPRATSNTAFPQTACRGAFA